MIKSKHDASQILSNLKNKNYTLSYIKIGNENEEISIKYNTQEQRFDVAKKQGRFSSNGTYTEETVLNLLWIDRKYLTEYNTGL